MAKQPPPENEPEGPPPPEGLPVDEFLELPPQRVRRHADYDRQPPHRPSRPGQWHSDEPSSYYDDDEYEQSPRHNAASETVQFLIPVNVSAWSMAACYVGLISMCLPAIGIILGMAAIIFGVIALSRGRRQKHADYGKVTGDIRAILGIIFGVIAVVSQAVLAIILITQQGAS